MPLYRGSMLALLGAMLAMPFNVQAADIEYQITIEEDAPEIAHVTMQLPRYRAKLDIFSRATELQAISQVRDVRCGRRKLSQNRQGRWAIPRSCDLVSWTVDIEREDESGIAANEQKTMLNKSGNWWVFSAPTGLLRVDGEQGAISATFNVPHQDKFTVDLPSRYEAPAYIPLGNFPQQKVVQGGVLLNFISDDPDYTSSFINAQDHAAALAYLAGIIDGQEDSKQVTMILMGVPRERQSIGGAAGDKVMLVNYIYKNENSRPKERYFPIIIAIHEQFHQLSGETRETWVRESLAQYYATKAVLRIYPDNQAVRDIVDEIYQSSPAGEPGLLEVQRQVDEEKNFSKYSNFYNQGSAFWYRFDQLIQRSGGGGESLDDYIGLVMQANYKNNDGLPQVLRRLISSEMEGELVALENNYLRASDD